MRPLIAIIDAAERIVHWSKSCAEWTGCSLDDVRGKRLRDVLAIPDTVASPLPAEFQIDASPSPIVWTTVSVPGSAAGRRWMVVMGVDRHERECSRAERAGSVPFPDGVRLPMWAFDRASLAIVAANDATMRLYDLPADGLTGLRAPLWR